MRAMLRSFGAIIAGLVAASIVAMVVQTMGHMMFPPPKEVQTALQSKDAKVREKAILEYLPDAPAGALLCIPLSWGMGTFAGCVLAARLSRRKQMQHALIVGSVMMGCGILMLFAIPHPIWMTLLGIAVFPAATWAGAKHVARRPSTP